MAFDSSTLTKKPWCVGVQLSYYDSLTHSLSPQQHVSDLLEDVPVCLRQNQQFGQQLGEHSHQLFIIHSSSRTADSDC